MLNPIHYLIAPTLFFTALYFIWLDIKQTKLILSPTYNIFKRKYYIALFIGWIYAQIYDYDICFKESPAFELMMINLMDLLYLALFHCFL